jgi:hypothetical protein
MKTLYPADNFDKASISPFKNSFFNTLNMLSKLKNSVLSHLTNIPGWRTDRKIIVIESDDWGAVRMPSKQVYERLLNSGIKVDQSCYDTYDTLESREDLDKLFDLFQGYSDVNRNHPIMTFNTVMGNPDFEKIKEENFTNYHYEHFLDTYKRYYGDDLYSLWVTAIDKKFIRPQFHAREHLNVNLWMKALQKGFKETQLAFDHQFYALKTKTPSISQHDYLAAYWAEGQKDFDSKVKIIENGLDLFEKTFGFQSDSFIACNYVFPRKLEKPLYNFGVQFIQGQRGHVSPNIETGKRRIERNYTGQKNKLGQRYLVRNCLFEPSSDWNKDWVDSCMTEVNTAFKWKKPAIISSHRINYVGGLSKENRDRGLKKLGHLLYSVLKEWPEVEFLTTDQIGRLIKEQR